MKKLFNYFAIKKLFFLFSILLSTTAIAQTSSWAKSSISDNAFIKNEGQYDGRNWQKNNKIEYTSKQNGWYTFFTKKGITYRLEKLTRNPNRKSNGDHEKKGPSRIHISELIHATWLNSNPNVEIVAENKTNHYYTYSAKDFEHTDISKRTHVDGYNKITYKNIYNNIDVVYTFHPDGGIKYNIILHPGANPSDLKLEYKTQHSNYGNENSSISLLSTGELEISTSLGSIIEHKPYTFYSNNNQELISSFSFNNNNVLTFDIENYDSTQEVIIDPWVVSPAFNAGDFTREVETDAAGNVYVIGGEIPMELRKYNSAGVLQWVYSTPWDTNGGDWLGTLATNDAGTSYITQGTGAEIERVDDLGATYNVAWHNNNNGFSVEYWSITFNCDNTKLIVGGTKSSNPLTFPINFWATIYDIDISNGNVLSQVSLDTSSFGISDPFVTPVEVRSISSTKNSRYAFLTHKEVGTINQDFTACNSSIDPSFITSNTESLGYKCENFLSASQNGGGLKAITSNDNYIYTHKGDEILQWDANSGALLNTVSLPSGNANHSGFGLVVSCSGLDVDAAGNVYAGSMNRVVKFDANLNILSQVPTTGNFTVYDVSVNSNGEVIAGGAILDNGTTTGRGGRIESLNMSAGGQYTLVCCNTNVCPVNSLCTSDSPVTFEASQTGGTWTSSPSTVALNGVTGDFDPSSATPGVYTITYTLACGSSSFDVAVGTCSAMDVCSEANGDLTVNGGSGPYTWANWTTSSITPTNQTECTSCGGTWNPGIPPIVPPSCSVSSCTTQSFVDFGTGITITPPVGADTVQVTDGVGNTFVVNGLGTLPSCSAVCDATITQAGPFCEDDSPVTLTATETGGTWSGTGITNTSTGEFDPATSGDGSFVISYSLGCGDTDTMTILVNPLPETGSNGALVLCSTDLSTDLFAELGGSPDSGGSWSPVLNSGTGIFDPSIDTSGTYTYTVTNGCGTSSNNVVVTVTSNPDPGTNGTAIVCSSATSFNLLDSLNGSPDAGGTWSPILNSGTGVFDPSIDAGGTYTYTLNACGGGTLTAEVEVTILTSDSPGANGTAILCSNSSTINLMDSLTGTPDVGGTWSPVLNSGTDLFDPTIDAAGSYTYSVIDCEGNTISADVVVTINPTPNTGLDGALVTCPTDPSTDLFTELGGLPDGGGSWSPALNSGTGVFDPSIDAAGTYTYTVTNSCGTSSNDVVVTITASPDPGTNGTAIVCSNSSSINLTDSLTGTPDAGGTWSPALNSGTDLFDPTVDAAGTYTYTVNACGGGTLTADVVVTVNPSPESGIDGNLSICPTDPTTDLFTELGGSPDGGGSWSPALNSGTGVFDPSIDAAGTYTYTVTNSCGTSNSDVVVTITASPDPGTNGTAIVCSNSSSINLTDSLTGTPDAGGTWSPALNSGTGVFDPSIDAAGTYTYTVNACGGGTLTADVVVTVNPAPYAGNDGAIDICSTASPSDLFTQISGSPDLGGTWSPSLNSGTGVFDPSIDAAGTYTYTVTNSCGNSTSNVVVTISTCTVPVAQFSASNDTICVGSCINFTDQSVGATSWAWSFTGGNPSTSSDQNPTNICYDIDGSFNVELTATNGFGSDTYNSTIVVHQNPVLDAGADVIIDLNESTPLNATGTGNNYTWSPPTGLDCVSCPNPIASPEETITYTVISSDANGCTSTDDVTVFVEFENVIFVPNIFSPNGDNANDILYVRGKGVKDLKFYIYDRWGEKVFETTSLDEGWDGTFRGKEMNKAVFVYYLEATFIDGKEVTQKGDITLIK